MTAPTLASLISTCLLLAICSLEARAEVPKPVILAGEIVIGAEPAPRPAERKSSNAKQQVDRARSWNKDQAQSANETPDRESEGLLSPRMEIPGSSAKEQRQRARDFQRGTEQNRTLRATGSPETAEISTAQDRAKENRARAAGYNRPGTITLTDQVGSDGIRIVTCPDANNSSGVIGDEQPISGNVIQILHNGKPMKVRCR